MIFSRYVVRTREMSARWKMTPSGYFVFVEQRAEIGTYDEELSASVIRTRAQPPLRVYPSSFHRGAMNNTAVAAKMVIPTAVRWTGASCCSCSARAKGVARFQQYRGHSTAAAVSRAAAQQSVVFLA